MCIIDCRHYQTCINCGKHIHIGDKFYFPIDDGSAGLGLEPFCSKKCEYTMYENEYICDSSILEEYDFSDWEIESA